MQTAFCHTFIAEVWNGVFQHFAVKVAFARPACWLHAAQCPTSRGSPRSVLRCMWSGPYGNYSTYTVSVCGLGGSNIEVILETHSSYGTADTRATCPCYRIQHARSRPTTAGWSMKSLAIACRISNRAGDLVSATKCCVIRDTWSIQVSA